MKTLVTGGGGFVGLNVVEALLRRGEAVVVLNDADLPPYVMAQFNALPGLLTIFRADVRDGSAVSAVLAEHRPQRVVHAAVITSDEEREQREFDRIVDVNVKGVANVLAAAVQAVAQKVVYVSSGSVYGKVLFERDVVGEDDAVQPDTLYAITKYAAERVCARFRDRHGMNVVSVRLGSVFGPWERDTGVRDTLSLPFQIVRLAMAGEEIRLPHREPRRDWIYSRDAAAGIVRVLDADTPCYDVYNLASGLQWSRVGEQWCESLRRVFPKLAYRISAADEAPNVEFLGLLDRAVMATRRLGEDLGFNAAYDTRGALDDYVTWLEANGVFYERSEHKR